MSFLKYGLSFKLTSCKGIWPGYTFPLLPFRVSQSPSINVVPFTAKDFSFAEMVISEHPTMQHFPQPLVAIVGDEKKVAQIGEGGIVRYRAGETCKM